MSRPVTALIVFSSKCHRCKNLHELIGRLKPELGSKVVFEDHDISDPSEQAAFAQYPIQRIPLIVVRGDGLDWAPPADLWWMGVPSEQDLRNGLGGLWVKNNAQSGNSNGSHATPLVRAVRVPASIAQAERPASAHKGYEHYAILDQPMSDSIKNLLWFNIRGLLSHLLAIEEHLAQMERSAINDSWCIQKHMMLGRNHHLLEAVNHAAEVSPQLSEKFKAMITEYDTNTEKPDIACIRKLRNWIREEVGDKTLGSGCPLCASDTAGAEKIAAPANGNGKHPWTAEQEERVRGIWERTISAGESQLETARSMIEDSDAISKEIDVPADVIEKIVRHIFPNLPFWDKIREIRLRKQKTRNGHFELRPYRVSFVPESKLGEHYSYAYSLTTSGGKELISPGLKVAEVPDNAIWVSNRLHDFRDLILEHILREAKAQHEGYNYFDADRLADAEAQREHGSDPKWQKMIQLMGKVHLLEV